MRRFPRYWFGSMAAIALAVTAFGQAQDNKNAIPFVRQPVPAPGTAQLPPQAPQQANVTVKVVEFQRTKGQDSGVSAYFSRRPQTKPFGFVGDGNGAISTADLTFPLDAEGTITVFLDRLRLSEGDLEFVLQALVSENKAFILSRPSSLVPIRGVTPTSIETVEENPYENPTVIGTTVVAATDFRKTGVIMTVQILDAIDDDGDWENTPEDTYFNCVIRAEVKELGEEIVVAEQQQLVGATQISAPTFVTRSVDTQVWIRNGQVLVLGGLFRNRKLESVDTIPGISKLEDMTIGLAERVIPGNMLSGRASSLLGNKSKEVQRRELVFFVKVEGWRNSFSVREEKEGDAASERKGTMRPSDIIGNVIGGITSIPEGIAEIGSEDQEKTIESDLSGSPKK
ncbi:MAG: hypothetical protein IT366_06495 [Candidatus Hydrogenedentes bacterium]|nr:hypothetical protein [Candidatus Hydrogenedentota bacterium]